LWPAKRALCPKPEARLRLSVSEEFFEKSPELFSRDSGAGPPMEGSAYEDAGAQAAGYACKSLSAKQLRGQYSDIK
jgi:hypothetical protein